MADSFLLQENGDFLLQENGDRLILDEVVERCRLDMILSCRIGGNIR